MGGFTSSAKPAKAIDLPSEIRAGNREKLFLAICSVGGKAVAAPWNAEKIWVVDPSTWTASAIDLPPEIGAGKGLKFGAICSVGGKAVAAPWNAQKVLVVDPSTWTASAIDLPPEIGARKKMGAFEAICSVSGKAVAAPRNAQKILVVDPSTSEAPAIAIDLPAVIDAEKRDKFHAICSVGGKAVAAPYAAEKILVVDPSTSEAPAIAIDLPPGIDAGKKDKFLAICSVGGKAVAAPWNAEKILVVDPSTSEAPAIAIDLPSEICAGKTYNFLAICSLAGKAVAAPCDADMFLVVDPSTSKAFTIPLPPGIDAGKRDKFHAICSVGGKAVAVPYAAEKILVVDPSTWTASAIDLPPEIGAGKGLNFGAICSVGGKAVAAPWNAQKVLALELDVPETVDLSLHNSTVHQKEDFVDLVAAVLASWVYTDAVEPPHIEGVTFEVHHVIQPCDGGTVAKLATVTAMLPTQKVLYVVFKGTSYMLDYLNWQLEHDNATTEDEDFFVHRGAAGTVKQLQFMKRQELLERLKAAKSQGVTKLIWTGHSLGGMYAQASFYLAWQMWRSSPPSQKGLDLQEKLQLFKWKCVAFGSPMVFGGGSQQARDFQAFAKDRAVNYIHADDPCPRAWGALDLRKFIQEASKGAPRLMHGYGSVVGYTASKFIPQAAEAFMSRPDFGHIQDLARKYDHFLPLKVLNPKEESPRWKEFQLRPESVSDHDVNCYVRRLFDAHIDP